MILEDHIAHINSLAFWKEFTFSKNKFMPQPGRELELADNLVWFGERAFVLQLKQREDATTDAAAELSWFRKKVLDKATSQIRDTIRFLAENEQICITNERGHAFNIKGAELTGITKIVVFLGASDLPDECWQKRFHLSRTVGFIHIIAAHDYLGILEKLRVPEDIYRYFVYREEVTQKIYETKTCVDEPDIMGAFLNEELMPTNKSRDVLQKFIQDFNEFDLSSLLGNLHDHINRSDRPHDYYRIMLEFARVPRSVWREVKTRLMLSLKALQKGEFVRPFRLTFPATDCAFMIAPLAPQIQATGPEGEKARIAGLRNLTDAAMYDGKASKGVGILVSKDAAYIQIDWHS